jgi:hypothetical protein
MSVLFAIGGFTVGVMLGFVLGVWIAGGDK